MLTILLLVDIFELLHIQLYIKFCLCSFQEGKLLQMEQDFHEKHKELQSELKNISQSQGIDVESKEKVMFIILADDHVYFNHIITSYVSVAIFLSIEIC